MYCNSTSCYTFNCQLGWDQVGGEKQAKNKEDHNKYMRPRPCRLTCLSQSIYQQSEQEEEEDEEAERRKQKAKKKSDCCTSTSNNT